MPKAKTPPPIIHQREVVDGYIHAYDGDGRHCWDSKASERVILVRDLRTYGSGLHIGQLGRTVPETTDGYKVVDVIFDTGQQLSVSVYALERVDETMAAQLSADLIAEHRNSRFDADPTVAEAQRKEWIEHDFGKYLLISDAHQSGTGDQELYAFTFPTLCEIATLKGQERYPVKIGYTKNSSAGALGRIRQQITESAAYPERPVVLCVWRTWDGRDLEKQVHRILRDQGRKVAKSLGREWYVTSQTELIEILARCQAAPFPTDRPVAGADETLEEGFVGLMAKGATIEFGMVPGSASVRIGVKSQEKDSTEEE